MKTIELIAIGNELLSGAVVNSNGAFLAALLRENGYTISRQTILPDEEEELEKGLKEALDRSSVVITTGGLGPTLDDLSKRVASRIFHLPLSIYPPLFSDLQNRFPFRTTVGEQATVPQGAQLFFNGLGTAPGLVLTSPDKTLILLPGVPSEMEEMALQSLIPFLLVHCPLEKGWAQEKIHFCLLPEEKLDPILRIIQKENPDVEIGVYPSYDHVKVTFSIHDGEESVNRERLQRMKNRVKEEWETFAFEENSLAEAIHQALSLRKKTLSFAESCSGGLLSCRITSIAGSSSYFLGSVVAYANAIKVALLSVKEETLDRYGAVSRETVEEMVSGVLALTGSDYAIAISGIAGPSEGTQEKPIGTVCIAVGKKRGIIDSGITHHIGNRKVIVERAVGMALAILWRRIVHEKNFFS